MKVLHVIDSLGRGGAEQVLVTLLPELQRQGLGVTLVVRGGNLDLAPEFQRHGINIHVLSVRHRWNLVGMARELSKVVALEKANLVHAHLYFSAVSTALMRVLRMQRVATCVTFHNLAYGGANRAGMKLAIRRQLAKFTYRRGIDGFFGVSSAVAQHYASTFSLPLVTVLPNPINLLEFGSSKDSQDNSDFQLILPGRLVKEKGHSDLLDALVEIRKLGMRPRLIVAGDGPQRTRIEEYAKHLGVIDQIKFTGALAHEDMIREIAKASVVVVPSRFEGFGLTALEAMALGRAVIASDAGGLPEVVGEAGVIVPAADPMALAEAIVELINNPVCQKELGKKALKRARCFNVTEIAARQIVSYQDFVCLHDAKA